MSLTLNLDHRGNIEITLPSGATRILEPKPAAIGVLYGLLKAQARASGPDDHKTGGAAAPLQSVLDAWMRQDAEALVRRFDERGKEMISLEELGL